MKMARSNSTAYKKAIDDVAENVSVAGLREALKEGIVWIRYSFMIVLVSMLGCTIYYTCQLVVQWKSAGYISVVDDITGSESLPMSNITVCASANVNTTFLKNNITIPSGLEKKVRNETGLKKEEFFDKFIIWMAITETVRDVPQFLVKYFRMLIQANPQMSYYSPFLRSAYPQCHQILNNCRMAGQPFDCCEYSIMLVDMDSTVCYQIVMSYDVHSGDIKPATRKQEALGPKAGLRFEIAVDQSGMLQLDDDISAGFKIFVNPVAMPPMETPLAAPAGAETFIKVVASEKIFNAECVKESKLPSVLFGQYYDQYGYICQTDRMFEVTRTVANCFPLLYHAQPNETIECGPEAFFQTSGMVTQTDDAIKAVTEVGGSEGPAGKTAAQLRKYIEDGAVSISREHWRCPKQCRYWEYSSSASYVDLDNSTVQNTNALYSRVHIYFVDFTYRQITEEPAIPLYVSFCNFGNVIGLYLGLSVVGIAEVAYWYGRFFIVILQDWNRRRRAKTAVQPSNT